MKSEDGDQASHLVGELIAEPHQIKHLGQSHPAIIRLFLNLRVDTQLGQHVSTIVPVESAAFIRLLEVNVNRLRLMEQIKKRLLLPKLRPSLITWKAVDGRGHFNPVEVTRLPLGLNQEVQYSRAALTDQPD
jgi:hypothetical protein